MGEWAGWRFHASLTAFQRPYPLFAGSARPLGYRINIFLARLCFRGKGDVTTVIRFGRSLLSLDRKSSALRLYCAPGVVDAMTINQLPLTFFSTSTYFPASESAREPAL